MKCGIRPLPPDGEQADAFPPTGVRTTI